MRGLPTLQLPKNWLARLARGRAGAQAAERAAFQDMVDDALRAGMPVTLVYLNIERFRLVLRQCGADGADRVLHVLEERLSAAFGAGAAVRLPGDEFLLCLLGGTWRAHPPHVLSAVRRVVATPFCAAGGEVTLSAAIGVACSAHDRTSFRQLFDQAEAAMLGARGARGGERAGTGMSSAATSADLVLADELRQALERNEFELHYQPQIDLRTGKVVGAEALIRWQHPQHGLLPPARFIDAAERTGMIVPIGSWVVQAACREAARWRAEGYGDLMVAVNLSACQFESGALAHVVQHALDAAALPPSCLELELTETILIHDTDNVLEQIRQLKAMGLALSLDDFGTGYSSLSYLKKFAVDKIKIDRSFVTGLGADPNDTAIVRAIVHIARSLGLRTIAEGVEDERTVEYLQLLSCDEVQGYHFAPPLSAAAFDKMLAVLARSVLPSYK